MNTGSCKSQHSRAWRDLYKAALFEIDKTRLPERIAQAEEALVVRARELFHMAGDNIEEEQALDDTMYALHALARFIHIFEDNKSLLCYKHVI